MDRVRKIDGIREDERCLAEGPVPAPLRPLFDFYDRVLEALLDAIVTAGALRGMNDGNRFVEIYLTLGTKLFQNAEAVYILVRNGWAAAAFPVYRSILSDGWTLAYLYFRPDLREQWLKEEEDTFQTSKEFRQAFREAEMVKTLREHGFVISDGVWTYFSKAAHGSAFGARFWREAGDFVIAPLPLTVKTTSLLVATSHACLTAVRTLLRAFSDHDIDTPFGRRLSVQFPTLEHEFFSFADRLKEEDT